MQVHMFGDWYVHTQSASVPDQIDDFFVLCNCHVMVVWDTLSTSSNVHTRDVRIKMCHSMYGNMPLLVYIHMKKTLKKKWILT